MFAGADVAFVEPRFDTKREHVDWLLKQCKEHEIDVFVPYAAREEVAERRAEFEANGINVIALSTKTFEMLRTKSSTYSRAMASGLRVPQWRLISSADELLRAAHQLGTRHLVSKPDRGILAGGFRILRPDEERTLDLVTQTAPGPEMAFEEMISHLERAERQGQTIPNMLIMPYLSGPELSIDILASDGELRCAIPRVKGGDMRTLSGDPKYLAWAALAAKAFEVNGIASIQMRQIVDGGEKVPGLLEINSRAAGGSWQGYISGVNIHMEAIRDAMGEPPRPLEPELDISYHTLENVLPVGGRTLDF